MQLAADSNQLFLARSKLQPFQLVQLGGVNFSIAAALATKSWLPLLFLLAQQQLKQNERTFKGIN